MKLSTPKVYTCSRIVAVSWKISVSNYCRWIWSAQIPCLKYVHTCILNTYVYLKKYNQNINLRQWNLQSHKFYCFIKDMCTLSLWSIYWTLSMLNFIVCVCVRGGGRGLFLCCCFNAIFFEFRSKSFSCQTNRIWKNIFIDNIFNANSYFHTSSILNLCTSRRTQLQQKLEMSVSFVILSWFGLFVLMFCVAANIFAAVARRFLST